MRGDYSNWLHLNFDPALTPQDGRKAFAEGLQRFNYSYFHTECLETAEYRLPQLLHDICNEKAVVPARVHYCYDLFGVLFDYMDIHRVRAGERLAETEVTLKVFDALDYAWAERKFVRIDGNTRFGKTESAKTWCAMHPGKVRMIKVPSSNSERDLVRAFAEALGFTAFSAKVIDDVHYVLRYGRIGFVLDECHFLLAAKYGRHTTPARLNWFRTRVVDQGLPCAIVTTPQTFNPQMRRYVRATGYDMQQFEGRVSLLVALPETLKKEDMFAVARLHFPRFGEAKLQLIIGAALKSESYLKAVEDIACRARWLGRKRGSESVNLQDVEAAIRDVVPEAADAPQPAAVAPAPAKRPPAPLIAQPVRSSSRITLGSLVGAP